MMELLVSIALVSLLLFLVNSVFNQTQQAISHGAAVSELIGASRATSEQFATDAKQMLLFEDIVARTGEPPGFLVIVQRQISAGNGPRFPTPQVRNQPKSNWQREAIRSDQIVFFRNADRLESLTPGESTRFDSDARAGIARVWYGHVSRPSNPAILSSASEEPGEGQNEYVTDLILGRQSLLLVGGGDTFPDGGTAGIYVDPSVMRIDMGPVQNLSGGYELWNGVTDVLNVEYDTALFNETTGFYELNLSGDMPTPAYMASALSWAFVEEGRRLIGDPTVHVAEVDADRLTADVGQTHSVFIPHVSDFAIEFAADIIDDYGPHPVSGEIVHVDDGGVPDDLPDGTPDTWDTGTGVYAIKWYSALNVNEPGGSFDATKPIVWGIPSGATLHSGETNYPAIYGAIGSPGNLPDGTTTDADTVFVFGHTGDDALTTGTVEGAAKWWPYLIRIRYRVHNSTGDFSSIDPVTGDAVSGRWFEQIIPIPR